MTDTPSDRDALAEEGRRLASEREDLISRGVDPATLDVPLHPGGGAELSRETLAAWWESFDGPAYPTGEQFSEAFLTSGWLAAHDRDLLGRAHAPIKAVLDKWDGKWPYSAQSVVDDLRAALDLAAVADHERDVQQRTLRDAATAVPLDCHDPRHMADWLRDRADGLEANAALSEFRETQAPVCTCDGHLFGDDPDCPMHYAGPHPKADR